MFDKVKAQIELRRAAQTRGITSGGERDIEWNLEYKIEALTYSQDIDEIIDMIQSWQYRLGNGHHNASKNFREISEKGLVRTEKILNSVLTTAQKIKENIKDYQI